MSNKEIAAITAQIEALTKVVSTLAASQAENVVLETPKQTTVTVDSDAFKARWTRQKEQAIKLAKKGQSVQLWAVPKGSDYQVWYFATQRKLKKGSVQLATVSPDGDIRYNDGFASILAA